MGPATSNCCSTGPGPPPAEANVGHNAAPLVIGGPAAAEEGFDEPAAFKLLIWLLLPPPPAAAAAVDVELGGLMLAKSGNRPKSVGACTL